MNIFDLPHWKRFGTIELGLVEVSVELGSNIKSLRGVILPVNSHSIVLSRHVQVCRFSVVDSNILEVVVLVDVIRLQCCWCVSVVDSEYNISCSLS